MRLRCAVLLIHPPSPVPASLPLYKNSSRPKPLRINTSKPHPEVLILHDLHHQLNPVDATLTQKPGWGAFLHPKSLSTRYCTPPRQTRHNRHTHSDFIPNRFMCLRTVSVTRGDGVSTPSLTLKFYFHFGSVPCPSTGPQCTPPSPYSPARCYDGFLTLGRPL